MPHLRIETNLSKSEIPEKFAQKTCSVVAQCLGKPLNVGAILFYICTKIYHLIAIILRLKENV